MYTVPPNIDPDKIFLINRSDLEGKLEVSYHLPSIRALEDKVRKKSSKTLKDFIVKIASGATPSVLEEEKYYSNAEEGIPFLRVQNLQINGELNLEDVKFINKQTHENYLKRSQVKGGNLLVKITGVGRMAIASVAPDDFIGNTNQHMVVINTGSKETSEYLANYLNLDFVEKLATRRATGGTRPALDYAALKSIPIIEDIDISLLKKAELIKKDKELKAKSLLDSIDDYLLKELDITLPEKDNSLEARMFTVNFSEVINDRLDPFWYKNYDYKIEGGIYNNEVLRKIAVLKKGQSITSDKVIDGDFPVIAGGQVSPYNHNVYNYNNNVITISASGAYSGYVWYHNYPIFASDCTVIYSKDESIVTTLYLSEVLKTKQEEIYNLQQGAGQPHVYSSDLQKLNIPLPPLEKQNEITGHIQNIRSKARNLQIEANEELEKAKQQIENMILN
ncbi:restriction endonuclease subunit S [Elizabethkingia anophelis]|nr:restriction endonuclease subunit S [Elizabethkingia anophelis]MCT4146350.1 restriction endonuclease subunit S [Elizabethkingia anophelis]